MVLDYTVLDPTGNITVLVRTPVLTERQPAVAGELLRAEQTSEQVGFLSPGCGGADIALRMAGGEFCGNATMCAATVFCAQRGETDAAVTVDVSGAHAPLRVAVHAQKDGSYLCEEQLPRCANPEEAILPLNGVARRLPLIRFGGISHLILPGDTDRKIAEYAAPRWCAELGAAALGLMLLDETTGKLTPLVYVPGGDTLYWEHSCASGSAAVGAYIAWKRGAVVETDLLQPGGTLRVSAGPVGEIYLRGTVKMLQVGQITVK